MSRMRTPSYPWTLEEVRDVVAAYGKGGPTAAFEAAQRWRPRSHQSVEGMCHKLRHSWVNPQGRHSIAPGIGPTERAAMVAVLKDTRWRTEQYRRQVERFGYPNRWGNTGRKPVGWVRSPASGRSRAGGDSVAVVAAVGLHGTNA